MAGGGIFLEIGTGRGHDAVLSKARSTEPRRFGSPTSAPVVLRELGIAIAQLDATDRQHDQKDTSQSRQYRAQAMREAHEAAAAFLQTTDCRHAPPLAPNLLERDFNESAPNQNRVAADITGVDTAEGCLYVAPVMDFFSRRLVGWAMWASRCVIRLA